MNKLERKLKSKAKFKKRLKNYGISENEIYKNPRAHSGLRTSGKPCSCNICSPNKRGDVKMKYRIKHKNNIDEDLV